MLTYCYTTTKAIFITSTFFKFNTIEAAERFHMNMDDYSKYTMVLGYAGQFWLVTNRDAVLLMRMGYERA